MDPLSRALNATIGRLVRWAGGQWGAGARRSGRQPEARDELLAAMGEVIASTEQMGRGYASEGKHEAAALSAEGRAAAAYGRISDDELAIAARDFLAASGVVLHKRERDAGWIAARNELRAHRDAAAARARQLEHR